jgi:MFS family permease
MQVAQVTRRRWATLAVLSVTLLLISLDTTILNVALPSIVRGLGASSSQLQWIVDAYAVVFAGLLLSIGALGDRVGRKWIFLAGLVVFAGGSALAAESVSADRLMVARAVMGVGAAGLMPCTLSILTNVFTEEKDRVRAIGIWSGTTGLGVALGPILGGFLLAHFWWGSVFFINVPVALLGLVAAVWLVPNSRNPTPRRPDPVGTALSIFGLGLLLWGIIEAPGRGWTSAPIMASLLAAGVVITSFVIWELHVDHPMLPLRFFTNRRYSAAIAARLTGRSPGRRPTRADQARRPACSGCPPGVHLCHGPGTHRLRRRGRSGCPRRAGAASQQGDGPDRSKPGSTD